MHSFAYRVNRMVWNNRFDEAEAQLKPYIDRSPRLAIEYANVFSSKAGIGGSTEAREEAIKQFHHCNSLLKTVKSDEKKIKEYIALTLELNRKATELDRAEIQEGKIPNFESEKTQSLVPFKDEFLHLRTTEKCPLEFTELELKQNYGMDFKVQKAEIDLWLGVTQFQNNSPIKGAYNLRKAWKQYEALLNELKQNEDKLKSGAPDGILYHCDIIEAILSGVGIFYYLLSVLPPAVAKLLEFIGFSVNRELGVEYLEYVASRRGFRSTNAFLMLVINYLLIPSALENKHDSLDKIKAHMGYATEMFPKGGMILFAAAQYSRKMGDYQTGIQHLRDAIANTKSTEKFQPNNYYFELGMSYSSLRDYQNAATTFEAILNHPDKFEFKSAAGIALWVCYMRLDQKDKAVALMKTIPKLADHKARGDKYVQDKLQLLKQVKTEDEREVLMNLAIFDLMYLKRDLAHLKATDIEPLLADLEQYEAKAAQIKVPDVHCAMFTIKGAMYRALNQGEKANVSFDKALTYAKDVKHERQWPASAAYERGELEYFAGNLTKAEHFFKLADTFGKYGFEEVLRSRIKLALRRVHTELKHKQ